MDDALILGTYADLKTIKTRSVVQVVIEVPIEMGEHVVRVFGFPQPGREVPVVVGRLKDTGTTPNVTGVDNPVADQAKSSDRPRTLSQQIGALCASPAFTNWAKTKLGAGTDIAEFVRKSCGVASRRDILPGTSAETKWKQLYDHYWLESRGYV
jgi:hypothetical protein